MGKHKNKNRTPKKTFLEAMQEIEPSLTEDSLFDKIFDNALEIKNIYPKCFNFSCRHHHCGIAVIIWVKA